MQQRGLDKVSQETQSNGQNNANNAPETSALWGGRFSEATDAFVQVFTASVGFDQRLAFADIQGSRAHAQMLVEVGVLTQEEGQSIQDGLNQVEQEIRNGEFQWRVDLEDVHMNIETRLTQLIGINGKKLHTGRSRNDQVATDIRLYLRSAIDACLFQLRQLQKGLVNLAEEHAETILPGFTHLQVAQPVTLGHHLLAWTAMLVRDEERLVQTRQRVNFMPLGSAALAGTTFPINREITAKLLGFEGICDNSLDAVSDRDFAIEFLSDAAMVMMHLSRMSEEVILWMSAQFQFIDLPDRFCTGSSIMPQKKNPDVAELVRGKTARSYGHLMGLLTLMKSQPLAYNKDNQEDKEPLFDGIDTLYNSLMSFAQMLPAMKVKKENMRKAALQGFSTATDLADYLVRKNVPFRDAHECVGSAVAHAQAHNCDLSDLSLETLQSFSDVIEQDVFEVLTLEGSVAARDHLGGTAPNQVRASVARHRERFERNPISEVNEI